jgi:hypothetical protein
VRRALALGLSLASCTSAVATTDAGADAPVPDASAPRDAGTDAAASDAGADAAIGPATGTIVPLYTDPSDDSWDTLVAAASAHPSVRVVAIVNPNSGPTPTVDPAYATGIARLQAAHVLVVGYVATGYGDRTVADVDGDIDLYAAQYPTLDGIFFDEAAIYETGHEARYGAESAHARTAGMRLLVANPGTTPDAAYDDLFDVALVYETDGAPTEATLAAFAPRRDHSGIIPYAVTSLDPAYVASIRPDVMYVYLTDDDLPNPWDTLPPYFDALLGALE